MYCYGIATFTNICWKETPSEPAQLTCNTDPTKQELTPAARQAGYLTAEQIAAGDGPVCPMYFNFLANRPQFKSMPTASPDVFQTTMRSMVYMHGPHMEHQHAQEWRCYNK